MSQHTEKLVERLRELLAVATPGPWEIDYGGISSKGNYADVLYVEQGHIYSEYTSDSATLEIPNPANATLIVEAINALPTLLESLSVNPLREDVETLKVALVQAAVPLEALLLSKGAVDLTEHSWAEIENGVSYIRAALKPAAARKALGEQP